MSAVLMAQPGLHSMATAVSTKVKVKGKHRKRKKNTMAGGACATIPSFDSELVSSKPKGNHMESLLRIVAPKAGGVPLDSSAGGSSVALEEDYKLVEDKIEEVAAMETGETRQDIQMEDVEMVDGDDDTMEGDPPIESPVPNVSTFFLFWGGLPFD